MQFRDDGGGGTGTEKIRDDESNVKINHVLWNDCSSIDNCIEIVIKQRFLLSYLYEPVRTSGRLDAQAAAGKFSVRIRRVL